MTEYVYLLQDAYTLELIGELPLTPTDPYTRLLSGCGSFAGTIPLDHPMATRANFKDRATNVIVLRDDAVDWFGLTTSVIPNLDPDTRTVMLGFREPTIWWQLRTNEVDKHYTGDICAIVRRLWTVVTTKTDAGGINANLDNIAIGSGSAGITRTIVLAGSARHFMQDVVDLLTDNDTGLEYRCDFSSGASRLDPQCTIQVGAPLGTTKTQLLTEHVTADLGRELDWSPGRGATRTHAVGAGFTATKQNTGSITAGLPLMELRLDRSNVADHDLLNDAAREARRKAQPPVQIYDAQYIPHPFGLTVNTFNPGDTVPFDTHPTDLLTVTGTSRRVVGLAVMPQIEEAEEYVGLTFNLPLDELGT